jgi:hypothetical protein
LTLTGDDHITALAGTPFEAKNWQPTYPLTIKPNGYIAFNVDFAPTTAGKFLSKITFSSDASKSDSVMELEGNAFPTDVAENQDNSSEIRCKLSPQPTSDATTLTVAMPSSQTVTISIVNLLGQQVATLGENILLNFGEHTFPISTTGYAVGKYCVEVRSSSGMSVLQTMTIVR